jgi:hypothetical protein
VAPSLLAAVSGRCITIERAVRPRRFGINAVAGRARRPLGELTISLRSIRAKACYSLRDANLPPAPGEYARGGVQYDGRYLYGERGTGFAARRNLDPDFAFA